jgi:hypothetical protein
LIVYNNRRHLFTWGLGTLVLALVAVGVRLSLEPGETESLPGGKLVGLAYGIAGGLLILFALSLTLLRFVPGWWFIGSRAHWLKGHIWLGLLSFVLILCHTGLRFGGLFEKILYLVYFLVVLTGILGLALQQFLPRWMTLEVPCEVPMEQMPNVCAALREKADLDIEEKCQSAVPATSARINQWYSDVMRPFLSWPFERRNLLSDAGKTAQMFAELRALPGIKDSRLPELLTRLQEYCDERRRLARQETLHFLLHGWLYVHVPLSWGMTLMMLVHAVMAGLYYHQ